MSIVFPNRFTCLTRTAVFDETEPVDFRNLVQPGLPKELLDQLRSRRFLVSASQATSQVNGTRSIDFTEVLLKVPVHRHGRDLLFPAVAYVDHEYSLARGYMLGFHKRFAAWNPMSGPFTMALPDMGLQLDLSDGGESPHSAPLPKEQDWPLLLWRDFDLGETVRSHGFGTLVVEDCTRNGIRDLQPAQPAQTVAGRQVTSRRLYEIRDDFVLAGALALPDATD